MMKKAFLIAFLLFLMPRPSEAQWLEPKRLKIGVSGGFGGVHAWGKPSFDVHWHRLTGRVSPGLAWLSGGLTYKLAFFNPKVRSDRAIIISGYYLNDWLLAHRLGGEFKKDRHVYMLMPGIHVDLNHRGTVYFQVSAGLAYMHERLRSKEDNTIRAVRDDFFPMGEIRIGGIFLSRKEHVQQFPHYYKKKPADRIKKRKLKFND